MSTLKLDATEEEIDRLFEEWDEDDSGLLDIDELKAILGRRSDRCQAAASSTHLLGESSNAPAVDAHIADDELGAIACEDDGPNL
mmetsp:Transcript_17832/g.29732  ORF Transcript_17832/g.29732 Transcript_17832/m.29732 type:complete len:85 (-) Transcript_17832:80-334(-)